MTSRWKTRCQYRRLIDSLVAQRDLLKDQLGELRARHDVLVNVVNARQQAAAIEGTQKNMLGYDPLASPEDFRAARISEIFSQLQSVRKQMNHLEDALGRERDQHEEDRDLLMMLNEWKETVHLDVQSLPKVGADIDTLTARITASEVLRGPVVNAEPYSGPADSPELLERAEEMQLRACWEGLERLDKSLDFHLDYHREKRLAERIRAVEAWRKLVALDVESLPKIAEDVGALQEQMVLVLEGAEAVLKRVEQLEEMMHKIWLGDGSLVDRLAQLELNRVHVDDYALVEASVDDLKPVVELLKEQANGARGARVYHAKRVDDLAGDVNRLARVEDLILAWARQDETASWTKLVDEGLSRVKSVGGTEDQPPDGGGEPGE